MAPAAQSTDLAESPAADGDRINIEPDTDNETEPTAAKSMPNGQDSCAAAAPANEDTTVPMAVPSMPVHGSISPFHDYTCVWVWCNVAQAWMTIPYKNVSMTYLKGYVPGYSSNAGWIYYLPTVAEMPKTKPVAEEPKTPVAKAKHATSEPATPDSNTRWGKLEERAARSAPATPPKRDFSIRFVDRH